MTDSALIAEFERCRDALTKDAVPLPLALPPAPPHPGLHPQADQFLHDARVWAKRNTAYVPGSFAEKFYQWMRDFLYRDLTQYQDFFVVDTETLFTALTLRGEFELRFVVDYLRRHLTQTYREEIGQKFVNDVVRWKAEQFYVWHRTSGFVQNPE